MNQNEKRLSISSFLRQIRALYSASFKTQEEMDIYDEAIISQLREMSLDYNKLYDTIISNHNSNFAPPPAKIKELASQCVVNKVEAKRYRHPRIYSPITKTIHSHDCFPEGTTDEQIIKTYEKMFNCTGWKIVEDVCLSGKQKETK